MKKPTGKQILLPSLLLAVAALGTLFFLQIRWMNNSLQAQNMRYRRGVNDALNHVFRSTYETLNLENFDPADLRGSYDEWKETSPCPKLILSLKELGEYRGPRDVYDRFGISGEGLYFVAGPPEESYLLVLDREYLYGTLLMDALREYSEDYTYTLQYATREEVFTRDKSDTLLRFNLPLFLDVTMGDHHMDSILQPVGGGEPLKDLGGPDGLTIPLLLVDLNDGRGSVQFEDRLRRTNLGLIGSLALILVGLYFLLFRLYRAEESQRRVEQTFVASVSHELRTPIAVIKTASENLSRGIVAGEEKVKSYGSLLKTEADRLNRMVEGILYYSRMEGSGKAKVHWEPVNLRRYTDEILDSLSLTLKEIPLVRDLTEFSENVLIDRDSYRLILENLVANAFLHGEGASIRVRLISDVPSRFRLIVEDEGAGIPKREQKHIFDPFVRGKRSEKNQIRGSGLGLYLVKTAAEAMDGRAILESPYEFPVAAPRRGCRFTVIIPEKKEVSRESDSDD